MVIHNYTYNGRTLCILNVGGLVMSDTIIIVLIVGVCYIGGYLAVMKLIRWLERKGLI